MTDDGWRQEIVELHVFFEGWLSGVLPDTDACFERVEQVLATDFTFVDPTARLLEREAVLDFVRDAHCTRPGLSIRIENPQVRHDLDGLLLATYEEWQELDGEKTARFSTALMRPRKNHAHGIEWVHVHETWLRPPG